MFTPLAIYTGVLTLMAIISFTLPAARWLASARQKIVEETMRRLRERLGQSAPNAQSLLSLVKSQLDVSLFKVLK